jgi:hypothetical protein
MRSPRRDPPPLRPISAWNFRLPEWSSTAPGSTCPSAPASLGAHIVHTKVGVHTRGDHHSIGIGKLARPSPPQDALCGRHVPKAYAWRRMGAQNGANIDRNGPSKPRAPLLASYFRRAYAAASLSADTRSRPGATQSHGGANHISARRNPPLQHDTSVRLRLSLKNWPRAANLQFRQNRPIRAQSASARQ